MGKVKQEVLKGSKRTKSNTNKIAKKHLTTFKKNKTILT